MMMMMTKTKRSTRKGRWAAFALLGATAGGSLELSAINNISLQDIEEKPLEVIAWLGKDSQMSLPPRNIEFALGVTLEHGSIETLDELLKDPRFDPNALCYGQPPLFLAFDREDDGDRVKLLLDHGQINAGVAKPNGEGTALHLAIKKGYPEIALRLINDAKGPDINAKDDQGHTALEYAIEEDNPEILQQLLEQEDLTIQTQEGGMGPEDRVLQHARSDEVLHMLLKDHRVEINAVIGSSETVLRWLARERKIDALSLLISRKEEIDWVFQTHGFPSFEYLLEAEDRDNQEMLGLFKDLGADAPAPREEEATYLEALMNSCLVKGCAWLLGGLASAGVLVYLYFAGEESPVETDPLLGNDYSHSPSVVEAVPASEF